MKYQIHPMWHEGYPDKLALSWLDLLKLMCGWTLIAGVVVIRRDTRHFQDTVSY